MAPPHTQLLVEPRGFDTFVAHECPSAGQERIDAGRVAPCAADGARVIRDRVVVLDFDRRTASLDASARDVDDVGHAILPVG